MGLRCVCSATVIPNGVAVVNTTIDGVSSQGVLTFTATICPNCSPIGSAVTFNYSDNNDPTRSFSFSSEVGGVDILDCMQTFMDVTAQGVAVGVLFNGDASVTFQITDESIAFGDAICGTTLTANGHTFLQNQCASNVITAISIC